MSEETPAAVPAAEEPKSLLDRVGAALPIALTALATAFAGMSTTELQRSMFWRSYAAQDQAKATSQWTLAGFKRDRALICQVGAAQLRATLPAGKAAAPAAGPNAEASAWLAGGGPPRVALPPPETPALVELLELIRTRSPDAAVIAHARKIPADAVNAEIDRAEKFVEQVDHDWAPTLDAADKVVTATAGGPTATAAQAAGFELDRRRYRSESSLNQGVGYLYEARVKVSSVQSEKHQRKSENFFYAMLAAQVGATISALNLARRHKSLLWMVAGLTGTVAVVIAGYVYLSDI
jgi:hypothetical protein